MTEVSFYTGVGDRLGFVCRLLRKAHASGARVAVVGPGALLDRLDAALWTFEATEFVPHKRVGAADAPSVDLEMTAIVLAEQVADQPHREVLLNIGPAVPAGFEQFQRVLEVVGRDAAQTQSGRERFRLYKDRGLSITHHDLAA